MVQRLLYWMCTLSIQDIFIHLWTWYFFMQDWSCSLFVPACQAFASLSSLGTHSSQELSFAHPSRTVPQPHLSPSLTMLLLLIFIVGVFLWGGGEKISWCLEHFSSGSFESLAIEVCLIVMDYFCLPQLLPLWWQLQLLGASIYVVLERTYNLDSNSVWLCCLIKEVLWWHAVSFQILCLPPGRTNSMS